jgi:hypothetical protein
LCRCESSNASSEFIFDFPGDKNGDFGIDKIVGVGWYLFFVELSDEDIEAVFTMLLIGFYLFLHVNLSEYNEIYKCILYD